MPAFAGPQSKPSMSNNTRQMLLDPGVELTLRPMRYPDFYEMYRDAIRNTWTVEEISFQIDITDLHDRDRADGTHEMKVIFCSFKYRINAGGRRNFSSGMMTIR